MADLVLVLTVMAFAGLCLLYVRGCERIIRRDEIGKQQSNSRERRPNGDDYGRQHRRVGDRGGANGVPIRGAAVSGEVLMSGTSWLQFAALIAVLLLTAPALGGYLAKIYGDEAKKPGDRVFGPIERVIYQVCRVDPGSEQRWSTYALSVLAFSVMSFLLLYGIARFQGVLPFNPTDKPAVTDHVAFNAAVSFMTNTNWQSYSGEATMSHFTQMTGLAVQNFVSASAGMCVLAALIRGLARKRASTLGNFW